VAFSEAENSNGHILIGLIIPMSTTRVNRATKSLLISPGGEWLDTAGIKISLIQLKKIVNISNSSSNEQPLADEPMSKYSINCMWW